MDEGTEIMQGRGASQRCDNIVGHQERAGLLSYAILGCRADFAVTCVCVCASSDLPHDGCNLLAHFKWNFLLIFLVRAEGETWMSSSAAGDRSILSSPTSARGPRRGRNAYLLQSFTQTVRLA